MARQADVRKKTLMLPQEMLSRAQAFLKTRTERETVVRSLEEVLWRRRLHAFLAKRPWKGFRLTHRDLIRMRRE